MKKYVKPRTSNANIAVCIATPFKSRLATLCAVPVMMAV